MIQLARRQVFVPDRGASGEAFPKTGFVIQTIVKVNIY